MKNIAIILDKKYDSVLENNYAFHLRIKSVIDCSLIKEKYHINYISLANFTAREIINNDIFIFSKAQFCIPSVSGLTKILKKMKKTIIYDIDDYYIEIPSYSSSHHKSSKKNRHVFVENIGKADFVSVSTCELKSKLYQFNRNIEVVENTLETEKLKKHPENSKPINILVTSSDNLKIVNFKSDFLRCIKATKKSHGDNIKFIFLGKFLNIPNIEDYADETFEMISPAEYLKFLENQDIHIGLVPLGAEEDKETYDAHICKSNIKFLEFSKYGIAGIYSNINPYFNIENGITGIVVENLYDKWYEAIDRLIRGSRLRNKIVTASQEKLVDEYSKISAQKKFRSLIDNCLMSSGSLKRASIRQILTIGYLKKKYLLEKIHQKISFLLGIIRNGDHKEFIRISRKYLHKIKK